MIRLIARARARLAALGAPLLAPDRWVLLSACDWYPDGTGYPANHAAIAALLEEEARRA